MFYLTTHSTHFIYGSMASDIWLRTILIVREETRSRHMGYSFRFAARVLLCASSHSQDDTYHGLYYTSRGALAGTRNSSMGSFLQGQRGAVISQQDNALPLIARVVTYFLRQQNVNTLPWPAVSPIEHLWDVMERSLRLRPNQPLTLNQLGHDLEPTGS